MSDALLALVVFSVLVIAIWLAANWLRHRPDASSSALTAAVESAGAVLLIRPRMGVESLRPEEPAGAANGRRELLATAGASLLVRRRETPREGPSKGVVVS